MISCILLATGRLSNLQESLASFLSQDYPDCELRILNACARQTLVFDHPQVHVYNIKQQPVLPMRLKNWGIGEAKGEAVVMWDEMSVYLPGFLSQVAASIEGRQWCRFDREWCLDRAGILSTVPASEFSFAFTVAAWRAVGTYMPGINGACDRNLIAKITAAYTGDNTPLPPTATNILRLGTKEDRDHTPPANATGIVKLAPAMSRDYEAVVNLATSGKRESPEVCVLQLGRYGDIISILPFLKLIADRYKPPVLCVSRKFADIMDGVGYAKTFVTDLLNEEVGQALKICKDQYKIVINAAIWGRGHTQAKTRPSYNYQQWDSCGIAHLWNDASLRPVFDRRDAEREAKVIADLVPAGNTKPIICVNVSDAISSPCPQCRPVLEDIRKMWGDSCCVVDLAGFRAHRIYDMLGLFSVSACLVSVDSAFIHVAQAVDIGIVAMVNPKPWAGTIIRRNLVSQTDYQAMDMKAIHDGIAKCIMPYGPWSV